MMTLKTMQVWNVTFLHEDREETYPFLITSEEAITGKVVYKLAKKEFRKIEGSVVITKISPRSGCGKEN